MRKTLCSILAACLVLLTPGVEAYAAAGRLLEGRSADAPAGHAAAALPPALTPAPGLMGGETVAAPAEAPQGAVTPAAAQALGAAATEGTVEAPAATAAVAATVEPVAAPQPPAPARAGLLGSAARQLGRWLRLGRMPDRDDDPDSGRRRQRDDADNVDDLGNPPRDDRNDGPDGTDHPGALAVPSLTMPERPEPVPVGGQGVELAAKKVSRRSPWLFGASMLPLAAFGGFGQTLLAFPLIMIALIWHEMGHARVGYALGDRRAEVAERFSWRPSALLKHLDARVTVALPLVTSYFGGFFFGAANPVEIKPEHFNESTRRRDVILTTLAGPAANLSLVAVGMLGFAAFGALGYPALAAGAALLAVINVGLALFNLVPLYPLDGHEIMLQLLPAKLADNLRAFNEKSWLALVPVAVFVAVSLATGAAFAATQAVADGLLGLIHSSAQLAWVPAVAAIGMLSAPPAPPAARVLDAPGRVELIAVLRPGERALLQDEHLSFVDVSARRGVQRYTSAIQTMTAQLDAAGVPADELLARGATPIATYKRINATTLSVDAARAPELKQWLESRGHAVYANATRRIYPPIEAKPEEWDPFGRGVISMAENLRITNADKVHAIARGRYGEPGLARGLLDLLLGAPAPQPLVGVIDTGADKSHPLLKLLKDVKNATAGQNRDDDGHGTWVTSMVLNYAPWLTGVTHYKAFVRGNATLDDILKALTMSANDGNLVISNSWGDDEGDPNSPDSQLVRKLAQEGHIMVFAAGNAGKGANTVGNPAIVRYTDSKTGAERVLSIPATDRDKKVVYFSSRGPRSQKTKDDESYPHVPTGPAAPGYNTDGAWPGGGTRAISGTSMATPAVAGAIALLCLMFGVTSKGEKLDAVVNAVMATLIKSDQGPDAEGAGFIDVWAAYKKLEATLGLPTLSLTGRLFSSALGARRWDDAPGAVVSEYAGLLREGDSERYRSQDLRAGRRVYNDDVDPGIDADARAARARRAQLEAAYPGLKALDGPRGRLWLAARGL